MWIYLLIGLLFLILAVEGYFKGGVNGVITLLGVIIAINFSGAFGGFAYGWLADKWPIGEFPFWHRAVPTVAGFITIALLFAIAGLVVSIIIRKRLTDRWDEFQLDSYKGMNRKFGLCTGLITAAVYSVMMLAIIYRLGNFTVPFHQPGEGGDEGMLAMLNESRVQLDDTPFLKVAAAYDTTPELHYEVRDLLLEIWNDRGSKLEDLFTAYPYFYPLEKTDEIQTIIGPEEKLAVLQLKDLIRQLRQMGHTESLQGLEEHLNNSSSYGFTDNGNDGSEDDGSGGIDDTSGDPLYYVWKTTSSTPTLDQLLSNSDLVSIINYRYDELVSIERNSKEEKQLLAFIDDFRKFLKTGKSELYGKERIVGRWKFAKNVSLRETRKNYVNVSTAQEMRAIHFRMERLDGLWARAWIGEKNEDGEKKENVIQFFGHSESAEYNQVLKLLDAQYQKALDDGEIEEEEDWDNGNYSQPVGYNETYGEDGNDEENKANRAKARMERTRKVIDWANTKDPDYIERLTSSVSTFARSRGNHSDHNWNRLKVVGMGQVACMN